MQPPFDSSPARLRMVGVQKSFGATQALRQVTLEVRAGEVHALIGENGAGKSTLMKILSGAHLPDQGAVYLDGAPFVPASPSHARQCGIAMIYQELNLAPHLTVEENILLGAEPHTLGWIQSRRRSEIARAALAELHHDSIPLKAPVYSLSIAEQQTVEIARALVGAPKVIIMDEPTSSLTRVDTENLFQTIRRLKARGTSIIYISHFLEECQQIADRYTVLRDGVTVGSGEMAGVDISEIIRLMVGREIEDIYPRTPRQLGKPLLELRALGSNPKVRSVDLVLREGEILGIAGLIGAGRTETIRAVFGLDRLTAGVVTIRGRETRKRTPARSLREGLGFLSENRKEEGLMLNRSLADNLTLTRLSPFITAGLISSRRQFEAARSWMTKLDIRAREPSQAALELSGGNQQKLAMGRLLHHEADIYLLDEPTRGIDVGSKAQIYQLIGELAARGKAIIFVSSYLPELLGVCDNIAVMCRGTLSKIKTVEEWTEHSIISAAIGKSSD